MKKIHLMAITTVMALALASNVYAKKASYEETQVSNGGSIAGSVLFKGTVPAPVMEDLNKGEKCRVLRQPPRHKRGRNPPPAKGCG